MGRSATTTTTTLAPSPELRFGDVTTFLAVQRSGSITGAARQLGVTPSQVSKAVARLEQQLHVVLLNRSVRGVVLTDAALRALPDLDRAVSHLRHAVQRDGGQDRQLTLAAPSYLISLFLPAIAAAQPRLRLCGVELPPSVLHAHVAENFFDVGMSTERPRLPSSWHSVAVGEIRKGLLARPALARRLGPAPIPLERLLAIPFIHPVYNVNGQFVPVDDSCPIGLAERRRGHGVQTILVALDLAAITDQLVYGPVIAAHRHIVEGRLVELDVPRWRLVEPLHVACNTERLRASEHRAIVSTIKRSLAELNAAATTR
jgi:DNA-binding transcriptional LysR family regulator